MSGCPGNTLSLSTLPIPVRRLAEGLAPLTMHLTVGRSKSLRKSSPIVGLQHHRGNISHTHTHTVFSPFS